jgi:hypothetical protein
MLQELPTTDALAAAFWAYPFDDDPGYKVREPGYNFFLVD